MDAPGTSSHYHNSRESSRRRSDSVYRNGNHHPDSPIDESRLSPISAYRYKKRKHRRSSRSRSRSSSPETRRKSRSSHHFSSSSAYAYDKHGKTLSEYELENHALRTQLDMARKQIVGFEHELHNCRNHVSQVEHRLYAAQQENVSVNGQKEEILSVMKTLKAAVETLQKERLDFIKATENATKQAESSRAEVDSVREQLVKLTERNNTLSKKCVDLLETGKGTKERMDAAESELSQLKPHADSIEKKLRELEERLRTSSARVSTFEARERLWINEKRELDGKIRDLQAEREALKQQLKELNPDGSDESNRNARVELDGPQLEHLKTLHCVVESLHAYHRSEMNRVKSDVESIKSHAKTAGLTKSEAVENGVKDKK